MLRVCVVFITFVVFSSIIHAAPKFKSDIKSCYKEPCPEDTFACEKISKISFDRKNILHEIHCLGLKDEVLKNITTSEPSFYDPYTFYRSHQYSGKYQIKQTKLNSDITITKDTKMNDVEEINFNPNDKVIPKIENHESSSIIIQIQSNI
ncbi:uncharacterized protein [Diabrotica undecimpunctata]|uniref:uncharacterized protein isoform X2 n=1 Tax=Diabrotica undecimpunctata TaxID=50387 RepID=UPI003B631B97